MRLHNVTNALVIDLDKLSAVQIRNRKSWETNQPYEIYLLADGHEYLASFQTKDQRAEFIDKLIKAWRGDDESGVDDGTAAVD